jgi:hypothetical protein
MSTKGEQVELTQELVGHPVRLRRERCSPRRRSRTAWTAMGMELTAKARCPGSQRFLAGGDSHRRGVGVLDRSPYLSLPYRTEPAGIRAAPRRKTVIRWWLSLRRRYGFFPGRQRLEALGPFGVVAGVPLAPRSDAQEVLGQADINLAQREPPRALGACNLVARQFGLAPSEFGVRDPRHGSQIPGTAPKCRSKGSAQSSRPGRAARPGRHRLSRYRSGDSRCSTASR